MTLYDLLWFKFLQLLSEVLSKINYYFYSYFRFVLFLISNLYKCLEFVI